MKISLQIFTMCATMAAPFSVEGGPGRPPTNLQLVPPAVRVATPLLEGMTNVKTDFKVIWQPTDGSILSMAELWETREGRRIRLIESRDQALTPELSAVLEREKTYLFRARNYTANDDPWASRNFSTAGYVAAPRLTMGLVSGRFCPGAQTTLEVHAEGDQLSYHWTFDGDSIAGANGPIYAFIAAEDSAGEYEVTVSNAGGKVSSSVVVEVSPAVTIVEQPQSTVVADGGDVSFSVYAEGETDERQIQYQWFKDNVLLADETAEVLTLLSASLTDAGIYHVTVVGECGVVKSIPAQLTVRAAIVMSADETYIVARAGTPTTLRVQAQNTTSLQWMKTVGEEEGVVDGGTGPTLHFPAVTGRDAGEYWLNGSNDLEEVSSDWILLDVLPPLGLSIVTATDCQSPVPSGELHFEYTIDGLSSPETEVSLEHLDVLVDGKLILRLGAAGERGAFRITETEAVTPGCHSLQLKARDVLGYEAVAHAQYAVKPGDDSLPGSTNQLRMAIELLAEGIKLSWPKAFVLGEEPGLYQIESSYDLLEWYASFLENDPELQGEKWVVVIPIVFDIEADELSEDPLTEVFRLAPFQPEVQE